MRETKVGFGAAILLAMLVLHAATAVAAPSERSTKGDAEAVLEAFPGGGQAVLLHSEKASGPAGDGLGGSVAIRPFSGTPYDGAHYCGLDWHTISIVIFDGGDSSFRLSDFQAEISTVGVAFTLDSAPLANVAETSVRRFLDPPGGLDVAFAAQWGRVMAPSDLDAGAHTLEVDITDPGWPPLHDGIVFFSDSAGTGACL